MTHSSLITRHPSRLELALVVMLFLLAFFFRTYELTGLGLGLEHDEVAEWQIANSIRHGESALFFKEAYGQEPLFLYLMAGSTTLIGDNAMAIRFTSVFVAMLTLAASYRLLRRMFTPTVALVALAGMAIALWPVFWGRVGLRAMTLPLMLALGFDFFWRGLVNQNGGKRIEGKEGFSPSRRLSISPSLRFFIIAGVFFGLSAYTYLSSRALPILLLIFSLYLALFARNKMRNRWRSLFACFISAGLISLPLVITLLTQPDLQFRVSEVSGPLDKALRGDSTELAANIPLALGMFTRQGDTTVRDNWPDRPVFPEPLGQLLFLGGVIVALSRLRQPSYVLTLLWIGVMLIPTIVTTGAPNFTRTLGALPMVFALPGFMVEWLFFWVPRLFPLQMYTSVSRITNAVIILGLFIVFVMNAGSTYQDYFINWPQHPETLFVFQADFAAIAKDIDASTVTDVSVGGLSNDTLDDPSLYLLRNRKDVRVRWFDSGSPLSSGGATLVPFQFGKKTSIYFPSLVPVPAMISSNPQLYPEVSSSERFKHYHSDWTIWPAQPFGTARFFDDTGILITSGEVMSNTVAAGKDFSFNTWWVADNPVADSRRIFVHIYDPRTQQVIAQHDGLDSPPKFWRDSDSIIQTHQLSIPANTPPGQYEVRIGLYNPVTGKRVRQTNIDATEPPQDYYVLRTIEVIR